MMSALFEYEHTSWSENCPLCVQLKHRADAAIAELEAHAEHDEDNLEGLQHALVRANQQYTQAEAERDMYKWQREIQVVGALDYNGAIARLDQLWETHVAEKEADDA